MIRSHLQIQKLTSSTWVYFVTPIFTSVTLSLWILTLIFPKKKDEFTQCWIKGTWEKSSCIWNKYVCVSRWIFAFLSGGEKLLWNLEAPEFPPELKAISQGPPAVSWVPWQSNVRSSLLSWPYSVNISYPRVICTTILELPLVNLYEVPCLSLQLIDHTCNQSQATFPCMQWSGLLEQSFLTKNKLETAHSFHTQLYNHLVKKSVPAALPAK